MVRTKNSPKNNPRPSSTPNPGQLSTACRSLDFSAISPPPSTFSTLSFLSSEFSNTSVFSSSFESIPSNYQENVVCIPKLSFKRVCKDILNNIGDFRFQPEAIEALQVSSEKFLIEVFYYSALCAENANRVTIKPKDIQLIMKFLNIKCRS